MAPATKKLKEAAKLNANQHDQAPPEDSRPSWPVISPCMPPDDLHFSVLLSDQILTISNLWTTTLCKKYVHFLSTLPFKTTPGKPKRGEALRVNDRYQIYDAAFAERLWQETALAHLVQNATLDGQSLTLEQRRELWGGDVLGLNSNIRIYRYVPGHFFAQHYDESNNVTFSSSQEQSVPARTTWTLLLYLTSSTTGCVGGETVFHREPASKRDPVPAPVIADLEVGMALLHRHGADCLLHEGREVTAGEKWVIRSDLCVRR